MGPLSISQSEDAHRIAARHDEIVTKLPTSCHAIAISHPLSLLCMTSPVPHLLHWVFRRLDTVYVYDGSTRSFVQQIPSLNDHRPPS